MLDHNQRQDAFSAAEDSPGAAAGGGYDGGVAQWTLLQLCDSGLPTGGFAHSGGLEAAVAQGLVTARHTGSLLRFVRGALANASSLQLPLVRAALAAPLTLGGWVDVDCVAHACITAEAAKRASLAQGAGLLRAAQAMFPLGEEYGGIISEFRALVRSGSAAFSEVGVGFNTATPAANGAAAEDRKEAEPRGWRGIAHGHHAPAFGMVCRALGIGNRQAARAFMFLVSRDVMSAATRLSLIGPLEAGRLVSSLSGYVESLVTMGEVSYAGPQNMGGVETESSGGCSYGDGSSNSVVGSERREDERAEQGGLRGLLEEWGGEGGVASRVCQVDPVQDIVQGLHDRLYSRMFNS